MNENTNETIEQNIGKYQRKYNNIIKPRKVDSDSEERMALSAVDDYKNLKTSVENEIELYKDDKKKCIKLKEYLGISDDTLSSFGSAPSLDPINQSSNFGYLNTSNITEKIVSSQNCIKNNFIIAGISPGLENSKEAAKQLEEFINLRNDLYKKINSHSTDIDNGIKKLEKLLSDIKSNIDILNFKIRTYTNKRAFDW